MCSCTARYMVTSVQSLTRTKFGGILSGLTLHKTLKLMRVLGREPFHVGRPH
jgi:hypothetical protein